MCYDWWMRRRESEAEASRRIWADFERTAPAREPGVEPDEPEIVLSEPEGEPAARDR